MTQIHLSLGSNLGDRKQNLANAIQQLREAGLRNEKISPVVESPALLPPGALPEWNKPYLNLVAQGDVDGKPQEWLKKTKAIQTELGRTKGSRWSPRPMDIDIMLWGNEEIDTSELKIPHPELHKRAFVLSPLLHLQPGLSFVGHENKKVLQRVRLLSDHIPLWMGILNVTPDSFSEGRQNPNPKSLETRVLDMIDAGSHILDIGAESTRPGAASLSAEQEWRRLKPVLKEVNEIIKDQPLPPLLSVDTYHPEVADKALSFGVDIINDVSSLTNSEMLAVAGGSGADWVAMHSLSVPADRTVIMPTDQDPVKAMLEWIDMQKRKWDKAGLDFDRIIFDPGIGFGKTSLQSQALLRHIAQFKNCGLRLLVGHSRKSYMQPFGQPSPAARDIETIGASLSLCGQGVDILRVHDVASHHRAYLSWAHLECYRDTRVEP